MIGAQSSAERTFPFALAWDDSAPSAIDLSTWLPRPAGRFGFVRATADGHLTVAGAPVRFWGTNTTFAANFPDKSAAAAVAARLAKFGVNLVRLHHLDASSVTDRRHGLWRTVNPDRDFDSGQLDRLDYFVYQLKQRGTYVDLNLLVTRPFNRGGRADLPAAIDQVSNLKTRAALGFFDPQILALQRQYAQALLTHVNPYTGVAYAREPAIAFIELQNENGLAYTFLDGQLDDLPEYFIRQLGAQWTTWLIDRYRDHTALRSAWGILDDALGDELITNGNFAAGSAQWFGEQHDPARATLAVTGDGPAGSRAARIDVLDPGTAGWHVQFNQGGLPLVSGRAYTLSLAARASAPRTISVDASLAESPWSGLGFANPVALTTEWRNYEFTFTVDRSVTNGRINFSNMGLVRGTIWLANVSLRPGGSTGLYADENLMAGGIRPFRLRGEQVGRTAAARMDWFRFLQDIERTYWTTLRDYIRRDLGAQQLLIGTSGANSTPTQMAAFDVNDVIHPYWRFPEFPGRPFSTTDWYQHNDPMVNMPAESTVAGMAVRRLANRPNAVMEYSHPSPNTFAAESMLFLATYGSLHGFDALAAFDYNGGEDPSIMTGNIFGISANPAVMGPFIPAAAAFLRGDIALSQGELFVPISPEHEVQGLLTATAWPLVDATMFGVDKAETLRRRVGLVVGDTTGASSQTPVGVARTVGSVRAVETSDTDQIRWDTSIRNRGLVTVDTPRSKFAFGFLQDRRIELSGVTITGGESLQRGFGVITLTSMDGRTLDTSRSMVLTAVGAATYTGTDWREYPDAPLLFPPPIGTLITLHDRWGSPPARVEGLTATVRIQAPFGATRVWALDAAGQRRQSVSVTAEGGDIRMAIAPAYQAVWYEIEVTRP